MNRNQVGFTLIEAMIVLTLITVTLTIAVPSYASFVLRSNRTEGIQSLLSAAACQERLFIRNNAFDSEACGGLTNNGLYSLSVTTANNDQSFVIIATPQGNQATDACGVLKVDDRGARTAADQTGEFAKRCWGGKWATS